MLRTQLHASARPSFWKRLIRTSTRAASSQATSTSHSSAKVLGIDLGTTNSAIAYHNPHTHTTEIIENEFGKRTTPSIVSYLPSQAAHGTTTPQWDVVVGEPARRQQALHPKSTFHSTKRFIGRTYKDVVDSGDLGADTAHAQQHAQVQYAVAPLPSGECGFGVPLSSKSAPSVLKSPSEVGSEVLKYLLQQAKNHFSAGGTPSAEKLDKCVITVPAYFNDQQRQATKHAGHLAGLKVLRVINEPTAAALAFGAGHTHTGGKAENGVIAVYDLGGGTFDVSVLDIEDGVFEVRSTNGDTYLGGDDFDRLLVDHVVGEFVRSSGVTREAVYGDAKLMQRIQHACEECKIELSHKAESSVEIPFALDGKHHIHVPVTEPQLDAMSMPLIEKTLKCVLKAIKDSDLEITSEIDEVLFVGGMTRMPRIRTEVAKLFNPPSGSESRTTKMNHSINPDESVAIGAAIQGAILSGEIRDVLLLDVIPLTLGIETYGGVFAPLVPRNTTIPIKVKELFSTGVDGQTGVDIKIFQGERSMCAYNQLIGDFKLSGIPPMKKGEPQIEVTFEVDADGIINVSAKERTSGIAMEISCVSKELFGVDSQVLENILEESAKNKELDTKLKASIEMLNKLEIVNTDCLRLLASDYLKPTLELSSSTETIKKRLAESEEQIKYLKELSTKTADPESVSVFVSFDMDSLRQEIMAVQQSLFEHIKKTNDSLPSSP